MPEKSPQEILRDFEQQVGKIEGDIGKVEQGLSATRGIPKDSEEYALAAAKAQWKIDAIASGLVQLEAALSTAPRDVAAQVRRNISSRLTPRVNEQKAVYERMLIEAHEWKDKDFYGVLGLARGASEEDIRAAHRTLSRHYHPDRPSGDEAKFREVDEAYKILKDAEKKAEYDSLLDRKAAPAPRPSPASAAPPAAPARAPSAPKAPMAPAGPKGWEALAASKDPMENLETLKTGWLTGAAGKAQFRKAFGGEVTAERWEAIREMARQARETEDEGIAAAVVREVEELRAAAPAAPDVPPPIPPSPPRPGAPTPPGAPRAPRAPRTTPEFRAEMERLRTEFFAEQARELANYRKGGNFVKRTLRLRKVREALGISHKEEWTPAAAAAKTAYEQARIAYGGARKAELIAAAGGRVDELARIQATLFKELVVDERLLQEQNNATSFPARERSIWLKSLRWYGKQNFFVKAAFSTAVITGFTVSTFGLGGAGATALYALGRFGRSVVGGAVGTAAAKGVGMLWDRRIRSTKEAGVAAAERTFTIDNLADVERAYKKTYDKEARQRLWKLASQAAAGIAVGASTSLLFPSPGAAPELKMPVTREDDVMRLYPTPEADKIDPPFPAPPAERGEIPGLNEPLPPDYFRPKWGWLPAEGAPSAGEAPPPVAPDAAPEERAEPAVPETPEKDIHPALAGMPNEVEVKRGDGWSMILDREFKKSGIYQEMTLQQRKNLVYGIIDAYGLNPEKRMIHPGALRLSDYGLDKAGLQEALDYARAGERLPRVILPADIPQARIGPAIPPPIEPPPPFIPETSPDVPRGAPPVAESVVPEKAFDAPALTESQQKILAEEILPAIEGLSAKEAAATLIKEIFPYQVLEMVRKNPQLSTENIFMALFGEGRPNGWSAEEFISRGEEGDFARLMETRGGISDASESRYLHASQAQELFEKITALRLYTGIEPSPKQSMYGYLLRLVEHAQQKK